MLVPEFAGESKREEMVSTSSEGKKEWKRLDHNFFFQLLGLLTPKTA